jgi:RimJ/RimL family protein N-acetyltransferase
MISILPVSADDAADIVEGIVQGGLAGAVPGTDGVKTVGEARAMLLGLVERASLGRELHFSVWLDRSKVIGMCALYELGINAGTARMGYWISKPYRSRGYGKRAAEMLLEIAFEKFGLDRVVASCEPSNAPSRKLLISLGFHEDPAGENGGGMAAFSIARA